MFSIKKKKRHGKMQTFRRHTEAEKKFTTRRHITRNVKGSSLGRRKMITDRHINLHKRIKSGENATDGS